MRMTQEVCDAMKQFVKTITKAEQLIIEVNALKIIDKKSYSRKSRYKRNLKYK